MNVPFGPPLFSLFCFLMLTFCLKVFFPNTKKGVFSFFTGFAFLVSFFLSVQSLFIESADSSFLFGYSALNRISTVVLALALFVFHISVVVSEKKIDFEFLACEQILGFMAMALLQSESLFLFPILFCLLFVLTASVPISFSARPGRESLKRGIIYGLTILFLLSGLISTLNLNFGSIYLSEVISNSSEKLSWLRLVFMGTGLFLFFTLFFSPPFNFFDKEYEKANSWPVYLFFRQICPLLGVLLVIKWSYVDQLVFGGEPTATALSIKKYAMVAVAVVSLWTLLVGVLTKKFRVLMASLLNVPLLFAAFGALRGNLDGLSWALLALVIYIFSSSYMGVLFHHSNILLSAGTKAVKNINLALFSHRYMFLILLFLLLPLGNQVYFAIMETASLPWHFSGVKNTSLLFLLMVSASFSLLLIKNAPLLFYTSPQKAVSVPGVTPRLWGYILLIPLIILGIHPYPLYKYVKQVLLSQL